MFEPFYPQEIWDSTYDIPFETWKDRGIKGVIFDIDNTLINTTGAVLHGLQRALRDVTGEHWDLRSEEHTSELQSP